MTRSERGHLAALTMKRWAAASLLLLLAAAPASAAQRGPSTAEERARFVELVSLTESEPWSEEAPRAREWLKKFLAEVPDLTFKHCLSLLGSRAERFGIPESLLWQPTFSMASYRLQEPEAQLSSTPTFVAGLEGALRAYSAWREQGSLDEVQRLEQLQQLQETGQLEGYVRARSRNCR